MTSERAEALKAAIRRSLPLILGLIVLGIVAVNALKAIQGPRYEANARVLISTTPLSSIITGTEPSFVDPQRVQQTALGIADAPEVYSIAARETGQDFGDADELRDAAEVTGDPESDLITFTATTSGADSSVGTANAVADAYVTFRGDVSSSQIAETIDGLQSRVVELPEGSTQRLELEAQLTRLQVLEDAPSEAELIQPADTADKTSPAPVKDSMVGFSIGLLIALLAVALREAIDTTVRSESQVEELLSTPVLASVRRLPRRTRMVTYGRHEAMFADTYALLAAQLVNKRAKGEGVALAVTSAIAQEGKTTTAANLAVAAGRRGARVILADFDFRKAALAELFRIPRSAEGALQVMSGSANLDDVLWSVALEGPRPSVSNNGVPPAATPVEGEDRPEQTIGGLQLLPSGGIISSRKVPQRSRLAWLVRELKLRADLVILDTPPALLTVEVAELSRMIDRALIVVRQGRVAQRNLRALGRQARTWHVDLAGAVMTDAQTEGDYSYYGSA